MRNETLQTHEPQFGSELGLFKSMFGSRVDTLFGDLGAQIHIFSNNPASPKEQRGIVVRSDQSPSARQVGYVGYLDHDGTCESTAMRLQRYADNLSLSFFPDASDNVRQRSASTIIRCSDICRVLPYSGTHPGRYSPLLEMTLESRLYNELLAGDSDVFYNLSEEHLKMFMENNVLPLFPGQVVVEYNRENGPHYRESGHQALAVDWNIRPSVVSQVVWDSYCAHMVHAPVASMQEIQSFAITPEIYAVPTTFGQLEFQAEKVISFWERVKISTGRIPDAMIFFTRGWKEDFIRRFDAGLRSQQGSRLISFALDDSVRQLRSYAEIPGMRLLRAVRSDAIRSSEPTPPGMIEFPMSGSSENIGLRIQRVLRE